jgi:hypothetical protein
VDIPDNSIRVWGNEPAGELDAVVQLEAPDLGGDEDLDSCVLVRFLTRHTLPREGCDRARAVVGPSYLGVIPVELARSNLEVHLLPLYRDLAGDECVSAFLGHDLHGLIDYNLGRPVVERWVAPAVEDLLDFEVETLGCHNGPVPVVHDDLELRRPLGVVVRLWVLAVLGSGEVDGLRLQLVVRAVVHEEATDVAGLHQQDWNHEDDGRPQVCTEAVLYGYPMYPLSFPVEVCLHVLAFKVVLQDSFLDFLQSRRGNWQMRVPCSRLGSRRAGARGSRRSNNYPGSCHAIGGKS